MSGIEYQEFAYHYDEVGNRPVEEDDTEEKFGPEPDPFYCELTDEEQDILGLAIASELSLVPSPMYDLPAATVGERAMDLSGIMAGMLQRYNAERKAEIEGS